jgi:FtsH-binding integral membrane protein
MSEFLNMRPARVIRGGASFDEGLRRHLLRVFAYMGGALLLTGLVAGAVASTPVLVAAIFGTPLKWVAMFAPLAFVFFLSFRVDKMSAGAVQGTFWAFAAVMGVSMASIFLAFTGTSIARAFLIAAIMFGGTALWGYTTKRDLSRFGSLMMMGVLGVVTASLVNLFVGSSAVQTIVSLAGVAVFTGLTAWDMQRIKSDYAAWQGGEAQTKLAVFGALSLYLNFVNIFQLLLNLGGQRE